MAFEQGPHLKAALFCEKVLQEKDGVVSIIRVIDRVTHTRVGPDAPQTLQAFQWNMVLLIVLASGRARGSHQVGIVMEDPGGMKKPLAQVPVFLEGEDRGNNLFLNLSMNFESEGLYWFQVDFDGEFMTRIPFRVIYQRVVGGVRPPGAP